MKKKFTLFCLLFAAFHALNAQNGTNEPCNATVLTVGASCALADTLQGTINTPAYTNSTSASSGVTLPALTCNGFTTTTRDLWYRAVVPASGKVTIVLDFGDVGPITSSWDMAAYASSSATCAGSTFTEVGKECVTSRFPYLTLTGLTAGATIYIRLWRQATSAQTDNRSFTIWAVDGLITAPVACATPVFPGNALVLNDDPYFVWTNDPMADFYDLYLGPTNVIANMDVYSDIPVSTPRDPEEGFLLPHAYLSGQTTVNLVQPNVANYWFVFQKNCATDQHLNRNLPACTPSSYIAAPIPSNDNCAGAILLNEDGVYKTFSSASSTQSRVPSLCSTATSTTASDVWFKFQTNAIGGSVTIGLSTFFMDAVLEVFSGTCASLTSIGCVDEVGFSDEEVLDFANLAPNTTYYIRAYNFDENDNLYGEEFEITVTGNIVIPVELVEFTGKAQGSKNALNWNTASERNANAFIVERSADGEKGFKSIGTVKASGTSSTPQYYAFLDENPLPVSYYRLLQVDFDGKEALSKVVTVQRKDRKLAFDKAFPSPVSNELTVQYSTERAGAVSLRVVDVFGRSVLEQNLVATEGSNVSKLAMDKLSAGAYILMLSDGQKAAQMRVIKQ
jgi:Secretion system C-terminal sorting domain